MQKTVFAFVVSALICTSVFAQKKGEKYNELGIFLGGSYYLGELNRFGHLNQFTRPAYGIIFRHNINRRLALKSNLYAGTVLGDDAASGDETQEQRNLYFKSKIQELAAELEFNFLEFKVGSNKTPMTPFVFIGVAGFHFNPMGKLGDAMVPLQPLSTEGQETSQNKSLRYKRYQLSVPFGAGLKFNISNKLNLALEWGFRKTFTDYIDDVSKKYVDPVLLSQEVDPASGYLSDPSLGQFGNNIGKQRGNPTNKDWYSFIGVIITFKLRGKLPKCPGVR